MQNRHYQLGDASQKTQTGQINRQDADATQRTASKEFVPAVDQSVFRSGSAGHDSLERRRRSQEQNEALKEAAAECSTLVESNSPEELMKYLDSLPPETKANK